MVKFWAGPMNNLGGKHMNKPSKYAEISARTRSQQSIKFNAMKFVAGGVPVHHEFLFLYIAPNLLK